MNNNKKTGDLGEDLAVEYLEKLGYKIIDRNVKTSYKEIDIIARYKKKTIFIEVKARYPSAFGSACDAFTRQKVQNIKRAMSMYSGWKKIDENDRQIDLIAIDLGLEEKDANITHYKDVI